MNQSIDILGIGCVAIDDLLYVGEYPQVDGKAPVLRSERQCGGLTATALVAAARLGARCSYAGMLGTDELSDYAVARFKAEGVGLEHLQRDPLNRAIHSVIIVSAAQKSRNIFYDLNGVTCAHPLQPAPEVIRAAKVLFVDHVALPNVLRAARIAAEAAVPVVADLENDNAPDFAELLALVDHLIVSSDFAQRLSGERQPALMAQRLYRCGAATRTVVVTCGSQGAWFMAPGLAAPGHQPAFIVETIDTTGCGDVFHGAYAAALAGGLDLPARVRLASAAAALKATRPGGQAGIPTRAQVEAYLNQNP